MKGNFISNEETDRIQKSRVKSIMSRLKEGHKLKEDDGKTYYSDYFIETKLETLLVYKIVNYKGKTEYHKKRIGDLLVNIDNGNYKLVTIKNKNKMSKKENLFTGLDGAKTEVSKETESKTKKPLKPKAKKESAKPKAKKESAKPKAKKESAKPKAKSTKKRVDVSALLESGNKKDMYLGILYRLGKSVRSYVDTSKEKSKVSRRLNVMVKGFKDTDLKNLEKYKPLLAPHVDKVVAIQSKDHKGTKQQFDDFNKIYEDFKGYGTNNSHKKDPYEKGLQNILKNF